jgi:hypothetical protein
MLATASSNLLLLYAVYPQISYFSCCRIYCWNKNKLKTLDVRPYKALKLYLYIKYHIHSSKVNYKPISHIQQHV